MYLTNSNFFFCIIFLFSLTDIVFYFSGSDYADDFVNFFLLPCKFCIPKNKFCQILPRFYVFLAEILLIVKSLKLIDNNTFLKNCDLFIHLFFTD